MKRRSPFRRMLVALESSPECLEGLDWVVALAARTQSELTGLFVEDDGLRRLAGHPAVSTVSMYKRGGDALEPALVERALRVQVEAARRALERAAAAARLESAFEVRRGRLEDVLLEATGGADLTIIGWTACATSPVARGYRLRPGALARAVAARAVGSVLILHHRPAGLEGPLLVAHDGSQAADRAMAAAASLIERRALHRQPFEVMVVGTDDREIAARHDQVREWLDANLLDARVFHLENPTLSRVCQAARLAHAGILLLGADLLAGRPADELLDHLDCSVLLVR